MPLTGSEVVLHPQLLASYRRLPALVCGLVAVIVSLALLGWVFDVPLARRFAMLSVAMNPLTAIALALSALSLCVQDRGLPRLGQALAAAAGLLAVAKLQSWLTGWDPGLDRLLWPHLLDPPNELVPNFMAPNTALGLTMLAIGLWHVPNNARQFGIPQGAALLVLLLGGLGASSYLFDSVRLAQVGAFIPIALHTSVCFTLLAIGLLALQPGSWPIRRVLSDGPGGALLRTLLPAAALLPVALAGLWALAAHNEWWTLHTQLVLVVTLLAAGLGVGLVFVAGGQDRLDVATRVRVALEHRFAQEELQRRQHDLEHVRQMFARYVSNQVAEHLLAEDAALSKAREVDATILFADIRDFTQMAGQMPAQDVVALLNEYFEAMVDVVFDHGGTLDKYLGDGLMVIFGAPVAQTDHADRAVHCATAMIEALQDLNQRRAARGQAALHVGIGIHSGPCVVGSIGSSRRLEYTAVGDTVNLASRIEGATKRLGTSILFSEATARRLHVAAAAEFAAEIQLRGAAGQHRLYVPGADAVHPPAMG